MKQGTTEWIRQLLNPMQEDFVFTTRIFIGLGTRAAIDKCLQRMVKAGMITRLARGVFAKGSRSPKLSPAKLAEIKANSFEKKIYEHPSVIAQKQKLVDADSEPDEYLFATNGSSSSSFMYGKKRIFLKAVSARKRHSKANPASQVLHALWHMGDGPGTDLKVAEVLERWDTAKQRQAAPAAARVPYWLLKKFPFTPSFAYENVRSQIDKRDPGLAKASFRQVTGSPLYVCESPIYKYAV